MTNRILSINVCDIRFPTSRTLDGSDAMNAAPDYSAAYVTMTTESGHVGHGLTFTIGRGNEIVVEAVRSLMPLVVDRDLDEISRNMGGFWRSLAGDSQLRWVGPEKGVIHLALAAIINCVWDLLAKKAEKPLWLYLAEMRPAEIVAALDFRFVLDALTPAEALEILSGMEAGKAERIKHLMENGYPAYSTAPGWLGYSEEKMRRLAQEALDDGFSAIKLKVGGDIAEDLRRAAILREALGENGVLMMDANQVWEVDEAVQKVKQFASLNPYWIEEPTSPDEILGCARIRDAIAPIRLATGEHCQNRVIFKQLLQAGAIDVCQIDVARLGGVNEAILVMLMARKFGIPVCPHGGGVGLCEYIQHLSMFDYVGISGSMDGRFIEHVGHLHEHFMTPIVIRDGRFLAPEAPGFSISLKPGTMDSFAYPCGSAWLS